MQWSVNEVLGLYIIPVLKYLFRVYHALRLVESLYLFYLIKNYMTAKSL